MTDFRTTRNSAGATNGHLGRAAATPLIASADGGREAAIEFEMHIDALRRALPPAGETPVTLLGIDHLDIEVESLERSIGFYTRVFGFRIAEDARHHRNRYVIMTASGHAYLALREGPHLNKESARSGAVSSPRHWGFVVGDLERARASLWDLGVALAAGSSEPDGSLDGRGCRSIYVDDPDGHRIELVQVWGGGLSSP